MIPVYTDLTFLLFNMRKRDVVFSIPERPIPYLELTYCFEGELQYYYNKEHLILRAGDAILIPPGSLRQRLETHVPTYYSSFNVQFPKEVSFPMSGRIPKAIHSNTLQYLETFRKDFSSVSGYSKEKCALTFSYLLYQLLENVNDTENPHVQEMKQYIMDNLHYEITLDDIASAVHLAPHYCCSLFKKHTDMTITQFITMQRIDLAKRLIITKDIPLAKIASTCGFSDYYYFSRTFHKITGSSAASYRKQSRIKF